MAGHSHSLSTLLCLTEEEEEDTIFQEKDSIFQDELLLGFSGAGAGDIDDDEYLQILLEREETSYGLDQSSSTIPIHDWIKCARLNAISWILKARELMGFQYQTAYLSLTYLDRFLSMRFIDSDKQWAIELLSVACLSLAAKMEEYKAPLLSSFPAQDCIFENRFIQRMELLVLTTLEWRLTCVTPFSYLVHFFKDLQRDDPSSPKDALSRAASLILSATKDSNLIRYRPSVIAGAATLTVFYQKLTRPDLEAKIIDNNNNAVSLFRVIQIEDLHSCYVRMQEIYMERISMASSNSTTPAQFLHTSLSDPPPSSNNKRKRLTFDQNKSSTDKKSS
ncbi:cyclin-D5-1-like [Impatiens glandulifera]|uniref:cyclin-D5-1-like n=1 Tax=Impatiens glandulifera TaxID=253017 RepID=UPI001FB0CAF1|nr:cyclin-D5-1-like [Impatiens glandulifera]